jgi:ABC-type multidrug transport system fused ATPase/permease subunit
MLILTNVLTIAKSWLYKAWGEAYTRGATHIGTPTASDGTGAFLSFGTGDHLPAPQDDLKPWLVCLLFFAVVTTLSLAGYAASQHIAAYATSKNMYAATIKRVAHATFRFYDVTPTGRLLNRLTSDISVLDNAVSYFGDAIYFSMSWIMSVTIIALISPLFLILATVLMLVFMSIFWHFLPTSRNLKRLEKVSNSLLLTNFEQLFQPDGLTTVRAFHAQKPFTESTTKIVDQVQSCTHFYRSLEAWLMYRYESIGNITTFLLTASALSTSLTPGLTAIMLNYAQTLINATHALCLSFGDLQTELISAERIVDLLNVEKEPPGTHLPPALWPHIGASITFDHVTVRYASHLKPSLTDITLRIPGGRITAVIGRTGSGKSTLAQALMNIVRAETGTIKIDGQPLGDIDVDTLRGRVTFIPQEPLLFEGTVRDNLDPKREFDDAVCAAALDCVAFSAGQRWALSDCVETSGGNFSQGQRQLLALTRAVLRRSPIVILDEATASIDIETATKLLAVICEEMSGATVLMVAHRVEAVRDADYVIVLEDGRVKRQGPTREVLAAEESDDKVIGELETE